MKLNSLMGAVLLGVAAPALAQGGGPRGPMTRAQAVDMQKQRFATMDANGDGAVTKEELGTAIAKRMGNMAPPPAMLDAMFQRMDTDGDGKAMAAEVAAAEMARFDAMDTDHDGTLTPDERRAGMAAMRPQ